MALILWIFRILLILFVIRIVLRFLSRLTGGPSAARTTQKPKQPGTIEGGQLVRDPNCGTYVAVGRALSEGSGDNVVFFCSEDCRHAWATRKAG
ncbi:MAG: hypothetical protein ABIP90_02070 [Vicinamibacterales bacterium]